MKELKRYLNDIISFVKVELRDIEKEYIYNALVLAYKDGRITELTIQVNKLKETK